MTTNSNFDAVDVIIPALNEEASLPLVLRDLPNVRHVYVVDNGCTDRTPEVAAEMGAIVVQEQVKGYGSACLRGMAAIETAIEEGEPAPSVVVFIDADYSDHPEELLRLVAPIFDDTHDFILGSRLLGNREAGAMPPQSIYGNKLACFLMRWFFRIRYTDLGPFRAIRYQSLRSLNMCDTNYGWTIEMQIKAARAKLRIKEVPASYRKRIGTSKISGTISGTVKAGSKILFTIARYGLSRKQASTPASSSSSSDSGSEESNPGLVDLA